LQQTKILYKKHKIMYKKHKIINNLFSQKSFVYKQQCYFFN